MGLPNPKDVLLHVKNKIKGLGVVTKILFPITRWENVLGAPRLLDETTIESAFPSEYAIYISGEVTISDKEFNACFGKR